VQTAVISYRVADFLKQHPPFQYMDEADLVGLASRGRVKFHETDEYLIWQGAAHGANVFVIQQGTVSLWEEHAGAKEAGGSEDGGEDVLRDIRGAGDLLGIDRFAGAEKSLHSAKSTSDVVVYAFPASEFSELVAKYPQAAQYLAAAASAGSVYQNPEQRQSADSVFLYDVVRGKPREACLGSTSICEAVTVMRASGREAIAIQNEQKQLTGILTADRVLQWIEEGGNDASWPVSSLMDGAATLCTLPLDAPISECVLAMASENVTTAAITERGGSADRFHGLVIAGDLASVFGEQPPSLLREIGTAPDFDALRELNLRVRGFLAASLHRAQSVDWLARFAHLADVRILERVLQVTRLELTGESPRTGIQDGSYCWCFIGAAGRRESLTLSAPGVVLLVDGDPGALIPWYNAVQSALNQCGYLPPTSSAAPGVNQLCASIEEWESRFTGWLQSPVQNDVYLARPMFDLLPVCGGKSLYERLATVVAGGVTKSFLYILANDCLSNLPPLTFFRDAVVSGSGEQSEVFDLEHTALDPLVDVGRVFGIAAGRALGASTLDRFKLAKTFLPEQESIFREASETLRAVLFHQARVGIRQRTDGSELPPALLSRHDRQVLKSGFRSILTLLEFTAECQWLEKL